MTEITQKDIDHLAKLSALKLTDEEKTKLLPQLKKIIGLVDQLQECDVTIDPSDELDEDSMVCNSWLQDCLDRKDFLHNVSHPTDSGMIELKTDTNQA